MNQAASEKISLTINGREVTVDKGTTIIVAARKLGIGVPHFCWHEGLSVAGVCRQCLVKVEGMGKLQIACNMPVTQNMKVDTLSPEVKDAQKWALEFHLVNHPLDCPICDQAGECKLQDYYMQIGRYESEVCEAKVLKSKAVEVGPELTLDAERCILCSRCVRFEDEITKTGSLGIFNRGDKSTIDILPNKKIEHNYSYNLVDICPVGAFTSTDFRFKCRVWFLKNQPSVCPGCSTGCNISLYAEPNERQFYRIKPIKNMDVNGYWMCDYGRKMYKHINADMRHGKPAIKGVACDWPTMTGKFVEQIKLSQGNTVSLVISPQYTNEEYDVILQNFAKLYGTSLKIYIWRPEGEDMDYFDGLLLRGDKCANTAGLARALEKLELTAKVVSNNLSDISGNAFVFGPEILTPYKNIEQHFKTLSAVNTVYFGSDISIERSNFTLFIPTLCFAEKPGTFTNFKGISQALNPFAPVISTIISIPDLFALLV